jgi:VRR-NUC domain
VVVKNNNTCEVSAATEYEKEGWEILDSGWPDFLLWRWSGGRIELKFSEVKSADAAVRDNQDKVLHLLSTIAPVVVCRELFEGSKQFREQEIIAPKQDAYYHKTDTSEWALCLHHEECSVPHHVCEPRG